MTSGGVRWLVGATPTDLDGYYVIQWPSLTTGWIDHAQRAGAKRSSLSSPAQEWLDWLAEVDQLAVTDVVLDSPKAVADLLGFVVEPAVRLGIELIVVADVALKELDDAEFVEADFCYPHALERLTWLLGDNRPRRNAPASLCDTDFRPDPAQWEAVQAGAGVVQIIAPAGSGKTAVLVERVRELRRRGVPSQAICCVTFNRHAKKELQVRLEKCGVRDVRARTFHGLGAMILEREGKMRKKVGEVSHGQWRRIASDAKRTVGSDGVWLDPDEAQAHISELKLGRLLSPAEYADTLDESSDPLERTVRALYDGYEEHQRNSGSLDNDDLIFCSLRLLRDEPAVRKRWQHRFECLLVDEYQDIEPAQELLVRILAAPHDQLFCVGDEDQTLYAFRRASVERIILLDKLYPALKRIALGVNYRCAGKIVAASTRLIDCNEVRFPKQIACKYGREQEGTITLREVTSPSTAAAEVAGRLKALRREDIAVLARTTNALRPVALACADQDIRIDGPPRLFEAFGARRALEMHLQFVIETEGADAALVSEVCKTPGRHLKDGEASTIAKSLRAGATFREAFAKVKAPRRERGTLLAPGDLFTRLADCEDAQTAVKILRAEGGFDAWFSQDDRMSGPDRFEGESLELAEGEASGLTLTAFHEQLRYQAGRLVAIRDEKNGMELATIHGSKGRQWPHVILLACDNDVLPHARSQEASAEDVERGEGVEAERRLAYVAFTRAQEHLELHYAKGNPSWFLEQAGLMSVAAPRNSTPARRAPAVPQPPRRSRPQRPVYMNANAVAQRAAQPAAATQSDEGDAGRAPAVAGVTSAAAQRHSVAGERRRHAARLVAQRRLPRGMTIKRVAADLDLTGDDLACVLDAVGGATARTKLRKLDLQQTEALARALRDLD
jgi:DNA helicase-2/ATP-dependent DNA helicase PcrA